MNRCERCGAADLLVVGFDGLEAATFSYCRRCEHRVWRHGAETPLPLATVLERASTLPERPRGRRRKVAR